MTVSTICAMRPRRNSFRHFVNYFWCCHGHTYNEDDWHTEPGRFYADIDKQDHRIKRIFPYHLELTKIGKTYRLWINVIFNHSQQYEIARVHKIPNKKEAIRVFLRESKKFENDSTRILLMWRKITHDIPIVNSNFEWVLSVLIGSATSSLTSKQQTLGNGVFYVLEFDYRHEWHWTKFDVSWMGHSSSGCNHVPFSVWKAIYGYDPIIDATIDEAIIFAKSFSKNDITMEEELADQYMQAFYDSQH